MKYAYISAPAALLLTSCATVSEKHVSMLTGTWVSNGEVTVTEADKFGTVLPDWVREEFGKNAYIVTPKALTYTALDKPEKERNWFKWKVKEETDTQIIIEAGSAIRGATQIDTYNKNIGCFEQKWNFKITDRPEMSFSYSHFYCRSD